MEKFIKAAALTAGLIISMVFMSGLMCAEWRCVWEPNTEEDLAGYLVDADADGRIQRYDVGMVTEYLLTTVGDSVCCVVYAYDQAGNVSGPSEVACAVIGEVNPYDLNSDGIVNRQDFVDCIRPRYGSTTDDELYKSESDLNKDGIINRGDYLELRKHYGEITQ